MFIKVLNFFFLEKPYLRLITKIQFYQPKKLQNTKIVILKYFYLLKNSTTIPIKILNPSKSGFTFFFPPILLLS